MNTHELRGEARAVARLLEALRGNGVVESDDDALCAVESESNFTECVEAAIRRLDELEAQCKAVGELIESYEARRAALKERAARIKAALLNAMQESGLKKLPLTLGTVTVAAGKPAVRVIDPDRLPLEFWRHKEPEPDLKAIAEALKTGEVPGCVLSNPEPRLMVRKA